MRGCSRNVVSGRGVLAMAVLCAGLGCLCVGSCLAQDQEISSLAIDDRPVVLVDLSRVGFEGMSVMARLTDEADFSLDFIDNDRILVTYNRNQMMVRDKECLPSHEDRIVHAAVFSLSSGKVLREADWYLHDRRPYLWPLGSGKFLLRKLNRLYEIDASLRETLRMDYPDDLLWVSTTPDGQQVIVEKRDWQAPPDPKIKNRFLERPTVNIEFLNADTFDLQRTLRVQGTVELQATASGFADAVRLKRDTWLVRFGPTTMQRDNIAQVKTSCTPEVLHPGTNTMLIGRCTSSGRHYTVSAYTVDGEHLWKSRWKQNHIRPTLRPSRDGSRFIYSVLATPPVEENPPRDEDGEEIERPLDQKIEVRETASGKLIFAGTATSTVLERNVSLSPDGRRIAMLKDTFVEVRILPRMSDDERTLYEALGNRPPAIPTEPLPTNLLVDAVSLRTSMFDWLQSSAGTIEVPLPRKQARKMDLPQLEPD